MTLIVICPRKFQKMHAAAPKFRAFAHLPPEKEGHLLGRERPTCEAKLGLLARAQAMFQYGERVMSYDQHGVDQWPKRH